MILQMCGVSGAGKRTLANRVKEELSTHKIEIVDGDAYRQTFCKDLGFSREDRMENIRRLVPLLLNSVNKVALPLSRPLTRMSR